MTESAKNDDLLKRDPNFEADLKAEVQRVRAAEISRGAEPTQECLDGNVDIEESSAGYNAFYFHCARYHGRSNYAVCQHTISAVLDRKMQLRTECPEAIQSAQCPAMKMRERERAAGKALFFVDRRVLIQQLEAKLNQPSEVVRFGKSKGGYVSLNTRQVSDEEATRFSENLAKHNVSPVKKETKKDDETFNADLAGRNLLGDAIENLMGGSK